MGKQEVTAHELKDCIRFAVEISEDKRLPFCIWGSHGIGKTEIVGQVAKEMNYNLVTVHLSTQDITDLIGIPYQKDGVQCWSTPKWLHDANEKYKATGIPNLFFLDEMNRGHQIVLKAMLPFLLDGTLHLHSIGPKDCVVAACNPPTDDYEVNEMTDKALLDRLGHVVFKPTRKEFLEYCASKGLDRSTMAVLKGNAKYTAIPTNALGFEINPSRRAIFNAMSVIGKKDKTWLKNRASHIIECYLGAEFRDLWISEYVKGDDEIDLEVLTNIEKNKDFIVEKITKKIDGLRTCAVDMVEKLTISIKSFIEERGASLNKTDLAWIVEFYSIPIIPEEFPTSVILNNDYIIKLAVKDKAANKLLGEFLKKRKVVSQAVEGW